MADRRNATGTQAGILRPDELARHVTLRRIPPGPDLAPWVEHHWTLAWDLPTVACVPSRLLGHPTANLTVERGHPRPGLAADQVLLTGVVTTRFDVELQAAGWVWGVRFRPGGLTALTGTPASVLIDRTVAAAPWLPAGTVAALDGLEAGTADDEAVARVEAALAPLAPEQPDLGYDDLLEVVHLMLTDRTLVRVADVERRCGIPRRQLQRLFARLVGVGPKWVLARYRMHDVVTALDEGHVGSLADLAAEHGWYDQAHFTRDFRTLVGVSPGEYRTPGPVPGSAY